MNRVSSHVTETKATDTVRKRINSFYDNGDALFRNITERDYGIDGIIELFDFGKPTGQIALLQIKGTEQTICPLKRTPEMVSCKISLSNANYALQNNLPVILIYLSLSKPAGFYFVDVFSALNEKQKKKIKTGKQKTINILIPVTNNAQESLNPMFETIKDFYNTRRNEE